MVFVPRTWMNYLCHPVAYHQSSVQSDERLG